MLEDFLEDKKLAQLNFKATRHQQGQRSSLLDLWFSNCPSKCTDIANITNLSSEHEGVKLTIKIKGAIVKSQFAIVRSYKELNAANIMMELGKLDNFEDALKSSDPNEIAEIVKTKLNKVVEKLAPSKRVQIKKKDQIKGKKARDAFAKARELKKKSIESNDIDDKRHARNALATANRENRIAHDEDMKKRLMHNKLKWKQLKGDKGSDNFPTVLNIKGEIITSQKRIAESIAAHFDKKVQDTVKSFEGNKSEAIRILEKLHKRRREEFDFKEISENHMYEVLQKAKPTRTEADDGLSMDIIKQIPCLMSTVLTHLINTIIRERVFPDCLKKARIIPLRKANKDKLDTNSYRPISILNPLEKLVEEVLREQLVEYFESNHIIPDQHQGGRNRHSTLTAKMAIDKAVADKAETWDKSIIIATNLSQAYDVVDHDILVEKLKFHGVRNESCKLIKSFLINRTFQVDVQGFKSKEYGLHDVSVIQGSKSGFVFHSVQH